MGKQVLVLGAGFAGVNAALRLESKGLDVAIIDIDGRHEFTPGIIDLYRGRASAEKNRVDLESLFHGTGVEFIEDGVREIEPDRQLVATAENQYEYENLVLALGGEPATYGLDVSGAETVYSLEGARNVKQELEDAESVVIVGSGYVGIETAGELAERGLEVTVVDRATRPMPDAPEKASHLALDYMNSREIRFMGGREVTEVRGDGVSTDSGEGIDGDLVLWSGGVQASPLVQESFDCGPEGLEVNAGLCSEQYPNVFAVGDCADTGATKTARNAIKQGRLVAENVVKDGDEELEAYDPGTGILVVSVGKTALLMYGDRVFESRIFRRLKDWIRTRYFLGLKAAKFKARFLQ